MPVFKRLSELTLNADAEMEPFTVNLLAPFCVEVPIQTAPPDKIRILSVPSAPVLPVFVKNINLISSINKCRKFVQN